MSHILQALKSDVMLLISLVSVNCDLNANGSLNV